MRRYISWVLVLSVLWQPFLPQLASASIATEVAGVVDKIDSAIQDVLGLTKVENVKGRVEADIQKQEQEIKQQKLSELMSQAGNDPDKKAAAERQAADYARSEADKMRAKAEEGYSKDEEGGSSLDSGKSQAGGSSGGGGGAIDAKGLTAETGNMSSLEGSAGQMASHQESLRSAGQKLVNTANQLRPIKEALETAATAIDLAGLIISAAGISAPIGAALCTAASAIDGVCTVLAGIIGVCEIMGETLVSMADQGKTDDATFFATLAKKTCELGPDLVIEIGLGVLSMIKVGKIAKWLDRTIDGSETLKRISKIMSFNLNDNAAKWLSKQMISGLGWKNVDPKKLTEITKIGLGQITKAMEGQIKNATGKDVSVTNIPDNIKKTGEAVIKTIGSW